MMFLKHGANEYHMYSLNKQQKLHENLTSTEVEGDVMIETEFIGGSRKQ